MSIDCHRWTLAQFLVTPLSYLTHRWVGWSGVGCEGTYLLRNADGALRL